MQIYFLKKKICFWLKSISTSPTNYAFMALPEPMMIKLFDTTCNHKATLRLSVYIWPNRQFCNKSSNMHADTGFYM